MESIDITQVAEAILRDGEDSHEDAREKSYATSVSVPDLVSRMQEAANADQQIMQNKKPGIPAANKFAMIPEVEYALLQSTWHAEFIQAGGLCVLADWLEPYADGSMPFRRTRACVIKVLSAMASCLDVSQQYVRDMLSTKQSKIANHVAMMANSILETPENKRRAKMLMERWARQTYASSTEDEEALVERMQAMKLAACRQARKAEEERGKTVSEITKEIGLKKESLRVTLPQGSKLDYVINPKMAPGLEAKEDSARGARNHKGDALQGLVKAKRRKSKAAGQAARVEIHPSSMMV